MLLLPEPRTSRLFKNTELKMGRLKYLIRRWWIQKEIRINLGIERTLHDELLYNRKHTVALHQQLSDLEQDERRRQIAGMVRDAI